MWALNTMFIDFSFRNLEGIVNLQLGDQNAGPTLPLISPVASSKLLMIPKPLIPPLSSGYNNATPWPHNED